MTTENSFDPLDPSTPSELQMANKFKVTFVGTNQAADATKDAAMKATDSATKAADAAKAAAAPKK